MKTNYLVILLIFTSLIACDKKQNTETSIGNLDLDSAIENAEKRRKANPDASGGNTCLLSYQNKYDQLITEKDILDLTGFSPETMEVKLKNNNKYPDSNEILYRFKNKRIGKIRGFTHELELPDVVIIREISSISANEFQKKYKAATEEDIENAQQIIKDASEGNINDPEAKNALKNAEQAHVGKEQIQKAGNNLLGAIQEVAASYENYPGLGDLATWNPITQEIIVLQNGVKFSVYVDISNDMETNKKVAVEFAKLILNKCKS